MDIKSKIESLMPGAWSKALFLGSLVLCIGLYKFFPDLPKSWLPQTEAETFLIRILLSGSVLLFGSVSLIINLVHHNRKIESELSDLKKQNTAYFHQVSSLNTDKHTLQTLLDESKQTLNHLTDKQITLRKSHAELTEQNNEHIAKIDMLTSAANAFRDEARALHNNANEIQKELTKLKADHAAIQQSAAEFERLSIDRKFMMDIKEKEIAELKKKPVIVKKPSTRSYP